MSKWKCDVCNSEFDNFHAEGFDNKIYCPLCFFKHEFNRLQQYKNAWEELKDDCREVEKDNDTVLFSRLEQLEKKHGIEAE